MTSREHPAAVPPRPNASFGSERAGGPLRSRANAAFGCAARVLVVTDSAQVPRGRSLLDVLAAALDGGADAILVRERHLPEAERVRLVEAASALCAETGALLVAAAPVPGRGARAGSAGPVRQPAGPGVHLRSLDLSLDLGPDLASAPVVGRSCHGVADLVRAADDRLDYVTLSPVAASASKPGYGPALGFEGLRACLRTARRARRSLPTVLALGGVEPHDAGRWVDAGADGVAVMGAVMRSTDPSATTRAVVEAVDAAHRRREARARTAVTT